MLSCEPLYIRAPVLPFLHSCQIVHKVVISQQLAMYCFNARSCGQSLHFICAPANVLHTTYQ